MKVWIGASQAFGDSPLHQSAIPATATTSVKAAINWFDRRERSTGLPM